MVAIIQFLGSNCDYDTKRAFEEAGAKTKFVWFNDTELPKNTDLIVIPGGFSYGDYLRPGAIARFAPIAQKIIDFANNGGKVLGICNGFQILLEMHLLPGAMLPNKNLHFISKFTHLKVEDTNNKLLRKLDPLEIINLPVAHADGNYYADEKTLNELEANNQILLRYCDIDGEYIDLNGSALNIAGICNKDKNVFALMPHPERATRSLLGSKDGLSIIKSIIS